MNNQRFFYNHATNETVAYNAEDVYNVYELNDQAWGIDEDGEKVHIGEYMLDTGACLHIIQFDRDSMVTALAGQECASYVVITDGEELVFSTWEEVVAHVKYEWEHSFTGAYTWNQNTGNYILATLESRVDDSDWGEVEEAAQAADAEKEVELQAYNNDAASETAALAQEIAEKMITHRLNHVKRWNQKVYRYKNGETAIYINDEKINLNDALLSEALNHVAAYTYTRQQEYIDSEQAVYPNAFSVLNKWTLPTAELAEKWLPIFREMPLEKKIGYIYDDCTLKYCIMELRERHGRL
jgi:hypothetical protein